MRRAGKWLAWIFAILIGLPVLLVIVVLIAGNTDPGRRMLESLMPGLSGGQVTLTGLSGRFPDALRVAHAELTDPAGAYLTMDGLELDWSPLRLLQGELAIDRLVADRVALHRLPQSSSGGSSALPVRVVLNEMRVARLDIAATVAGKPVALALDGSARVDSLDQGNARLTVRRVDGGGDYSLEGALDAGTIHAKVAVHEPADGLIAGIAGLPDLGALVVDASIDGPRSALATRFTVSAGSLRAAAEGQVDLEGASADLTMTASAPAMTPRPDIAWRSVALDARIHGRFTSPDVTGKLQVVDLAAAGNSVGTITAELAGNAGQARLHATIDGVRVAGPATDLFASAPLTLDATARLDAPDRPIEFTLRHPLFTAEGSAQTAGTPKVQVALTVPQLTPFATAAGTELAGTLAVSLRAVMQGDTTDLSADGTFGVTGGPGPAAALVGDTARFAVAATLRGEDVTISRLQIDGRSASFSANGRIGLPNVALDFTAALNDLADLAPTLSGKLQVHGHLGGTQDNLALNADLGGEVATRGMASGPLTARLEAQGLPSAPTAKVTAEGSLLGAPLQLALTADRSADGTLRVTIGRAEWKSAHAEGALSLAPSVTVPEGTVKVAMQRLDELAPLFGRPIAGSANISVDSGPRETRLKLDVTGGNLPGMAAVSRIMLAATVTDPAAHPVVDAHLQLDSFAASGVAGSARIDAKGPADALSLTVTASLANLAGAAAQLTTSATLNAEARSLGVRAFQLAWKQETLRLLAPFRIDVTDRITIDRMRFGLRQAVLEVGGRISPTLDLSVSLRNLPADLAAIVLPTLSMDGAVQVDARLTGTTARPAGTVKVSATGLRMRAGPGRALPPAAITGTAELTGTAARIDVRLTAGASRLTVTGRAPLLPTGELGLRAAGALDLVMLDPLLAAGGRRVRGQLNLDLAVTGTAMAPRVAGTTQLANGEVQDSPLGLHVTSIAARLDAAGDTLRLTSFTGRAGPGSISATGTIGVLAPGLPINIKVTARNARPLASDLMSAEIDADLDVSGQAMTEVTIGGSLRINRAVVRVPEKLPQSVATIAVRLPGARPPPPAPPPLGIALNLTIDAPGQVFVRGRGLDAELGGRIRLRGTAANPQPDGGFKLRRGTLSVVGHTLTFTEGQISFSGGGLTNPSLHLVATSSNGSVLATLTVGGTVREPKITLSSVPELPQDEVLAQLLFRTSMSKLGPFQIAELAAALASLAGAPSGLTDPLASIRDSLGLDVLSLGTSKSGSPTLQAGRYVAPRVYVGAKQSTSGGGTQATVQIDIAKGLKLETTVGTGGGSATGAGADPNGSSIGLTYQFEY